VRIAFVILLAVLLTGCPTHAKRILIIGDSISSRTIGQMVIEGNSVLDSDTTNRMTFTALATEGAGTFTVKNLNHDEYWGVLIPDSIVDGAFNAVVVELGTNDCAYLAVQGDFLPQIDKIVAVIRSADTSVPILWMTIKYRADYPKCAGIVNNDLLASGVEVLPYNDWADAHPECFIDGLHPKETWRKTPATGGAGVDAPAGYCDGTREYAVWLKGQLDNYFGPTIN
jgi:hypothetical protein